MKRIWGIIWVSILSTVTLGAQPAALDSLLRVLDRAIEQRPQYAEQREEKIERLKRDMSRLPDGTLLFDLYQPLFKLYRHYQIDSALHVANDRLALAKRLQNPDFEQLASMNVAEILAMRGMYPEAFERMANIDKQTLDPEQWGYYYHVYHATYALLAENAPDLMLRQAYEDHMSLYKDSLLAILEPGSEGYLMVNNGKLLQKGEHPRALDELGRWYASVPPASHCSLGSLAYGMPEIYEQMGDVECQKSFLAISAISDLRKAVKGYIALRKLALILFEQGELERAYAYIKCAMEDATFCKARFRTLEISQALPLITAAYDQKIETERRHLLMALGVISLLGLLLLAGLAYIAIQMRKLRDARHSIQQLYLDMKGLNTSLNEVNTQLSESNLVKETYIGSIFTLCATYIEKMEGLRTDLNRKLKAGQLPEALKVTNSPSFVQDELKSFFGNFDAIFLHIYPNFVDQFNELLRPEEAITPKEEDILTPELRVFALVRLGIDDTPRIARFLHYSPQTVYNYKLKIRNKLRVSKEEFAVQIRKIGS